MHLQQSDSAVVEQPLVNTVSTSAWLRSKHKRQANSGVKVQTMRFARNTLQCVNSHIYCCFDSHKIVMTVWKGENLLLYQIPLLRTEHDITFKRSKY